METMLMRPGSALRKHPIVQRYKPQLIGTYNAVCALSAWVRRIWTPLLMRRYDRLHLGCGPRRLSGWANVDISGQGDLVWDLCNPLPVPPGSIHFIYSEHFIEHVSRENALVLLKNCRRVLAQDGIIRLSTPNLKRSVEDYLSGIIPQLTHAPSWQPATPCVMLNEAMRLWGHQFVYDEAELTRLLQEAGFSRVYPVRWHESAYPELRELETRPYYNDIILEAA